MSYLHEGSDTTDHDVRRGKVRQPGSCAADHEPASGDECTVLAALTSLQLRSVTGHNLSRCDLKTRLDSCFIMQMKHDL